jgi:hypothetical protein
MKQNIQTTTNKTRKKMSPMVFFGEKFWACEVGGSKAKERKREKGTFGPKHNLNAFIIDCAIVEMNDLR